MLWELSAEQWLTSFALICCISFICGWVADKILGYAGFSVLGNWLLLLLGTYAGLLAYNMMGHRFYWNTQFTMYLGFGSALLLLTLMLSIKAVFRFR